MNYMLYAFAFIFFTCIGSFIGVCYDRIPKGEQIFVGRSHCNSCKKALSSLELIPIVSYVFLGGKCKNCRRRIPFTGTAIELVTAVLATGALIVHGLTAQGFAFSIITCVLHLLNFIARNELAREVKEKCKNGDAVFITYELSEKVVMGNNGNADFRIEFRIKDIFIRGEEGKGRAGYLNIGHLQCRFIGICRVPNSKDVYRLDVLYMESKSRVSQRFAFYVYGPKGEDIRNNYRKGQAILLQYKIEKSKRMRLDGKTDYYTNLVVERLT